MFIEFMTKNEFFNKYMSLFSNRFTMGSLKVEDSNIELTAPNNAIKIYNNMEAFITLIDNNYDKLSPYDVIDTHKIVTRNLNFLTPGYRKTQVEVRGANFFPVPASQIPMAMYSLFDSYSNIWTDLDPYEREANFHINFIRIHPFEDGNGRTGRILMNYNLCKQNKAPVIINSKERKKYFDFISNYDVQGFAKFLRKKSEQELQVMLELYETVCGQSLIDDEEEMSNSENVKIMQLKNSIKQKN